jgi:hypothetical protein
LQSLLVPRAKEELRADEVHLFCPNGACSVAYFSPDQAQVFAVDEVSVPIWQKSHDADDVRVCYCFNHTPGSIKAELAATGKTGVIADISDKMKAGLCACETNNPQGSCCLGNVNTAIKRLKEKAAL